MCNFEGFGVGLLLRLLEGEEVVRVEEIFFLASLFEVPRRAEVEDDDPEEEDELERDEARLLLLEELELLPELEELLLDDELRK